MDSHANIVPVWGDALVTVRRLLSGPKLDVLPCGERPSPCSHCASGQCILRLRVEDEAGQPLWSSSILREIER